MANFRTALGEMIDSYIALKHALESQAPHRGRQEKLFSGAASRFAEIASTNNEYAAMDNQINELMIELAKLQGENRELQQNTPKDANVLTAVVPQADAKNTSFAGPNIRDTDRKGK